MADVLQVITTSVRRGAERFAYALESELAERGHDVTTVALAPGTGECLPVTVLGSRRRSVSTLRALRHEMVAARVTVAHGSTTLPACTLAGIGTGRPLVYRNIGDPDYWASTRRRHAQSRVLLRRARAVVVLSETTSRQLQDRYDLDPARLRVIPTGVSESEFTLRTDDDRAAARRRFGLDPASPLVAYVGALSEEKDIATAIAAMAHLPSDWHILVAGDGPDRLGAERLASDIVPNRVHFIGTTSEPAIVMSAADVLVIPSRTEGLPAVAMEAALVGVPTTATDVGFIDEIVLDGVTGRVVPPGDDRSLADALRDVVANSETMGAAARQHALTHFSLSVVADQWSALLRDVVQ